MATTLDDELKRVQPAPKTQLQQNVAAGFKTAKNTLAGLASDAAYSMDPTRKPKPAQSGAQTAAGLGIGGLRPAHTPGAAIAAATPQQQPQAGPAPAAARENLTGTTTAPTSTPADPVAQPQGFKSTLSNGLTMTGDMQGNRTYTMGTPGQDGYGMMTVRGGQNAMGGQFSAAGLDLGAVARQNLQGRGQVGGYSFEGGGADFAKFAQQPTRPAIQDGNTVSPQRAAYLQVRDRAEADRAAREQLAGLDPRSGWGWKGRQDLYKHQQGLNQRDREVGARTMMDAAQLQAGQQQAANALAQKQQQFDAEAPARKAELQAKQYELGATRDVAMARQALNQLQPGTPEYAAAERKLASLSGKFGEQKQPNVQMMDEPIPGDLTGATRKVPIQINPDGTYSRMPEQGGQGGQQQAPAPQAALDYLKKNPGQAAAFRQKYGYLPPGF